MTSGGYHFTLFSWGSTDQIVCFKWAYFGNGPDAAALIAPTIIRHWPPKLNSSTCHWIMHSTNETVKQRDEATSIQGATKTTVHWPL